MKSIHHKSFNICCFQYTDPDQSNDTKKDRNNKSSANRKKKETEIKPFYLLSKKSSETVILSKAIHEIGIAFGAIRIGECSTSLQIRACKY